MPWAANSYRRLVGTSSSSEVAPNCGKCGSGAMASNSTKMDCMFKVRLGHTLLICSAFVEKACAHIAGHSHNMPVLFSDKPELHMGCQKHSTDALIHTDCASVVNMPSD